MPITDQDFIDLKIAHSQLKAEHANLEKMCAVHSNVMDQIQKNGERFELSINKRVDGVESKVDKELEKLSKRLEGIETKLEVVIEMMNQAKGASQAARVFWLLGGAIAAVAGWFLKGALPHTP